MKHADIGILSTNAKSHLAKAANRGEYRKAQASAMMYIGSIKSSAKNRDAEQEVVKLKREMKGLYSGLQKAQLQEEEQIAAFGNPADKKGRKKARKDSMVEELYDMMC